MSLRVYLAVVCAIATILPVNGQKCRFNGPQDAPTLRGSNFITNYGTGNCLRVDGGGFGIYRLPVKMDTCSWNTLKPQIEQFFQVSNSNGGSTLKPMFDSRIERCLTTYGGSLVAADCIPKSNDQTWIFNHVRSGIYQVMKRSNLRCLRAQSRIRGSEVVESVCNPTDSLQLWQICTK